MVAVAPGGGEAGADAAVALEGREGAPAAADFRGELAAADGVLASVARGGDVEAGGNSQTWLALRFSRRARTRPGCLPLCQGRDRFTEIP